MAFGGKGKAKETARPNEGEGYEMGTLRGTGNDGAGSYEHVTGESSKEPV